METLKVTLSKKRLEQLGHVQWKEDSQIQASTPTMTKKTQKVLGRHSDRRPRTWSCQWPITDEKLMPNVLLQSRDKGSIMSNSKTRTDSQPHQLSLSHCRTAVCAANRWSSVTSSRSRDARFCTTSESHWNFSNQPATYKRIPLPALCMQPVKSSLLACNMKINAYRPSSEFP